MSEGAGSQPIARWRVIASLALIGQVVILLALKSALEEESWFVGSLNATVEQGPLQLEGVSANLTIDMQNEQDDVSIEFFGPLRLSQWQNERDDRAVLSEQEVEEYNENLNETFDAPSPDTIKSTTFTLINIGIGFSVLLIVILCFDLRKQASQSWITICRRFASFGSFANTLAILLLILLALPASWFGTIAENPQDFSNNIDDKAFLAHAEFDSETSFGLDGFLLEFEVSGYDIAMIRPANRTAVEAEPPTPGTPDAESYILLSGEMRTDTPSYVSEMVYYWFVLWILIPFALLIQQRTAIDARLKSIKMND
ncbi:MAG: hypothetical protein VXY42_01580 [Candidatus Thermoplasmatota archaeon]|nr:hypothetical protein [Candidatus Thermoplasmatota archaeon]